MRNLWKVLKYTIGSFLLYIEIASYIVGSIHAGHFMGAREHSKFADQFMVANLRWIFRVKAND
jgi:hypothetical protein